VEDTTTSLAMTTEQTTTKPTTTTDMTTTVEATTTSEPTTTPITTTPAGTCRLACGMVHWNWIGQYSASNSPVFTHELRLPSLKRRGWVRF